MSKAIELTITGKPYTTKNSRQINPRTGKSHKNDAAKSALKSARLELFAQWRKKPSAARYNITIKTFYKNKAHWLDPDNEASFVLDALKEIVIKDDNRDHVARLTVEDCGISRQGQANIVIVLEECKSD